MDRDDDDGLSWDGDVRDPTHRDSALVDAVGEAAPVEGTKAAVPTRRAGEFGGGSEASATATSQSRGSVLLVVYGAVAAAYLLFTIGWVLVVVGESLSLPNPFFDFMYRLGGWLAVVAPGAWFGLTFLLTSARHGRRGTAARLICLAVGLVLVAPWPFIVGGTA